MIENQLKLKQPAPDSASPADSKSTKSTAPEPQKRVRDLPDGVVPDKMPTLARSDNTPDESSVMVLHLSDPEMTLLNKVNEEFTNRKI